MIHKFTLSNTYPNVSHRFRWLFALVLSCAMGVATAQQSILPPLAISTGNTTGHIANIKVTNTTDSVLVVAPQRFFIPARAGYQSYVAEIKAGITLAPHTPKQVPVIGYCTDVRTPPVPVNTPMTRLGTWIPIRASEPLTAGAIQLISTEAEPEYGLERNGFLAESPGFTAGATRIDNEWQIYYPGPEALPVGGTFTVGEHERLVAAYLVQVVKLLEENAKTVVRDPDFTTPYSSDRRKNEEVVTQHAVWMYMAALTGAEYSRDAFAEKIYRQYEQNAGFSVSENEATALDDGVAQFWRAFLQTGQQALLFRPVQ